MVFSPELYLLVTLRAIKNFTQQTTGRMYHRKVVPFSPSECSVIKQVGVGVVGRKLRAVVGNYKSGKITAHMFM